MVGSRRDGTRKNRLAHVVAWELTHGPVPAGLELRHLCGFGGAGCVNPDHMIPGTHRENVDDIMRMDRTTRGERNRHAKLTDEKVMEIRDRLRAGHNTDWLAVEFGVTAGNIRLIARGVTWRHLLPSGGAWS